MTQSPNEDIYDDNEHNFTSKSVSDHEHSSSIVWGCQKKNLPMQEKLNYLLPKHVDQKVKMFSVIEHSNDGINEENKFVAEILVRLCTEKDKDAYIKALSDRTKTQFNVMQNKRIGKKKWMSGSYCCNRNVRSKYKQSYTEERVDKRKRGHVKVLPAQVGKDTMRPTKIKYCLKMTDIVIR